MCIEVFLRLILSSDKLIGSLYLRKIVILSSGKLGGNV